VAADRIAYRLLLVRLVVALSRADFGTPGAVRL
jgi:hypothetical protein